jgi:hypothetical protein
MPTLTSADSTAEMETSPYMQTSCPVGGECSKPLGRVLPSAKTGKILDPKRTHLLAPDAKLKLTILSLSGIHVQATEHYQSNEKYRREQRRNAQNFAITASVSFTGSCDPADMRVVSSGLCTATGRLFVESRAICVPNGMTDGLIAFWDDSPSPKLSQQGSLYSTDTIIFGKQRGTIPACPSVEPHLFMSLSDDNEQEDIHMVDSNMGLTQQSTAVSSLSCGPDIDDIDISYRSYHESPTRATDLEVIKEMPTFADQSIPKNNAVAKAVSEDERIEGSTSQRQVSQGSQVSLLTRQGSSNSMGRGDFAIVNTPSGVIDNASVPEILEIHVALHINQVPSLDPIEGEPECENENAVQSSCVATDEGGGAIAHIVLFPDILNEDVEQRGSDDGGTSGASRIFELPVRKRYPTLITSTSSISGLTRGGDTASNGSRHRRRCLNDPEAYVDLAEDAMIRVKLELCTEEDIEKLENAGSLKDECAPDQNISGDMEKDKENIIQQEGLRNVLEESLEGQIENLSALEGDDDSPKGLSAVISNKVEGAKGRLNDLMTQDDPGPRVVCGSPGSNIDAILNALSGLIMNCSDNGIEGLGGAASMDSTIFTSRSINL